MKKQIHIILIAALISWGCASTYKQIQPDALRYTNQESGEKIDYSYKFDVLRDAGNKKYANKEKKHNIDVVSLSITNNTDHELNFSRDFRFYLADREIYPLEATSVTTRVRQNVLAYALWGLLAFDIRDENGSGRIILPIGIPIAILNMIGSNTANKKFSREFAEYHLVNKVIQPNETVYGMAAFRDIEYGRFEIKLID